MIRVGIIGAGLIAQKRALALKDAILVAVCDSIEDRAQKLVTHPLVLERQKKAPILENNWHSLVSRSDLDAVIVSTSNDSLSEIAIHALQAGKNVLIEKPGGRNPAELQKVLEATQQSNRILKVGFNHRFHPGFLRAAELLAEGRIGALMYIRARYGHGGRLGYEQEWRAIPEKSGGGELLDQGIHLIDLCRWLGGEFELKYGHVQTFFWNMPVEDNGFLLLQSANQKRAAFLHASCTEWKNLFDFEIFGKKGKIQIIGLGRSYGVEELRLYEMKAEMGPPFLSTESFPGEDLSWESEFQAFLMEIQGKKTEIGTIQDAIRSMEIVYSAYRQSQVPILTHASL